jgi:hypothetical protein
MRDGKPLRCVSLAFCNGFWRPSTVNRFFAWVYSSRTTFRHLKIMLERSAAGELSIINKSAGMERSQRIVPQRPHGDQFASGFIRIINFDRRHNRIAKQVRSTAIMHGL